jgi:hypothetical protein
METYKCWLRFKAWLGVWVGMELSRVAFMAIVMLMAFIGAVVGVLAVQGIHPHPNRQGQTPHQ